MPKTETGEFELVLGNRQLLSGFAVVAILFGVFFAMGYIVGRNSSPSARTSVPDSPSPVNAAGQPDPGRAPAPTSSAAAEAPPAPAPPAEAKPEDKPPVAEEPKEQPAAQARPDPPKPAPKTADAPPAVQSSESLQAGTYLQVMAIKKVDADVIAKALQSKGFPTLMTPSSLEGIFRVLVGPYKDTTSLGKAKSDLENSGFHPIVQKIADRS
jgi:cell division septation protein DedD